MRDTILKTLRDAAVDRAEGSISYRCIALTDVVRIAAEYDIPKRELSATALENGLVPLRYIKNIGTIGLEGQARLLRARAVIVGAGGIGGQAAELMARMGVGNLVLVDPDVFEETNLNRQNFACGDVLGMAKVDIVRDRLLDINDDVEVEARRATAEPQNLPGLLEGADVVIDGLDNVDDRLLLQEACAAQGVVMVHAAIAGTSLQAATIYPGDPGLVGFLPKPQGEEKSRGIEVETGNPAATPALAAAIQVEEAVKIICGRGTALRGKMLYLDTDDWSLEFIDLSGP